MNALGTHTFEVDGVRLSFAGREILGSVYLRVAAGGVTALMGRNGSGKSCLMRIMYGSLDIPDKSVRIDGKWVARAYEHGVMYAPQHGFVPSGRLVPNVLRDYGLDFESLIERFPSMEPHHHSPVATLSGGERRVLELFTVLASPGSRFCLLDEPFAQVSPLGVGVLKALIGEAARAGKGILISDHLWRDVSEISDDIYVIADRTVRRVSSPDELRRYGYIR
jgi:ABC-type multidrug transport system ATPase subunit